MRPYHYLYFALAASPAIAQTPPQSGSEAAAPANPVPQHRRMPERFAAANTTHDGHLTLAQAQAAGWQRVAAHFAQIDQGAKGYVTIDDIRVFNQAQRTANQGAAPAQ